MKKKISEITLRILISLINSALVRPQPLDQPAMLLTRSAFELLIAPHDPMTCKQPNFPEITLTTSECGKFKFFKQEKFFIVIFINGTMVVGFFGGNISNFSNIDVVYNINGKDVVIECGEKAFKASCAVAHLNHDDDSLNENVLEVLKAVLNAPEPKKAKSATSKLEKFDTEMWDEKSPEVMYKVQLLKFKDPKFRAFMLSLAQLAKDNGVDVDRCFFTEASGELDGKWGTGPGANVEELFSTICKEGDTAKLLDNLMDPKKRRNPEDSIFVGSNGLGKAVDKAFRDLVGKDFQSLSETAEEFAARIEKFGGFELFEYNAASEEPMFKRICKGPEADIKSDSPVAMESDEPPSSSTDLESTPTQAVVKSDDVGGDPSGNMGDDDTAVALDARTVSCKA